MDIGFEMLPCVNFSNWMFMERLSNVFCVKGKVTEPVFELTTNALLLSLVNLLYCPAGKSQVLMAAIMMTHIINVVAVGSVSFFFIVCCCGYNEVMEKRGLCNGVKGG